MKLLRISSLRFRVAVVYLIISVSAFSILFFVNTSTTQNAVKRALSSYSHLLENVAQGLNIDTFKIVLQQVKIGTKEFENIHSYLNGKLKKLLEVKYLYTAVLDLEKMECKIIVDGTDYGPEFSDPGYVDKLYGVNAKLVDIKKPFSTKMYKDPDWGNLITFYYPIIDKNGKLLAHLCADIDVSDVYSSITLNSVFLIAFLVLFTTISLGFIYYVFAKYNTFIPILEQFSNYDFTNPDSKITKYSERKEEIGIFARSVIKMSSTITELLKTIQTSATKIDDSVELTAKNIDTLEKIVELNTTSSNQLLEQIHTISASVQETTSSVEEVTASSQSMIENLKKLSIAMRDVVQLSEDGEKTIKEIDIFVNKTQQVVDTTTRSVNSLENSARSIEEIVSTINNIAEQTNLLALNAAIEAARAGEAGRGFAVVADEIRKLAEESKVSTGKIAEILKGIVVDVENTTRLMESVSNNVQGLKSTSQAAYEKFTQIESNIKSVAQMIENISGNAEEIGASMEEVSSAMDNANKAMNALTEKVEELSDVTRRLEKVVTDLEKSKELLEFSAKSLDENFGKFKI